MAQASSAAPSPGLRPRGPQSPRDAPLRSLALTVEAAGHDEFRWRILEDLGQPAGFQSIASSPRRFAAYDAALATGYGELQRLIGAELQHGPRSDGVQPLGKPAVTSAAAPGAPVDGRAAGGSADITFTPPSPKEITA